MTGTGVEYSLLVTVDTGFESEPNNAPHPDAGQLTAEGAALGHLQVNESDWYSFSVQAGDSLAAIAFRFNSTVEDILEQNEDLEDANAIFAGQLLIIRVNLVTPVPTEVGAAEETEEETGSDPGTIATLTPTP